MAKIHKLSPALADMIAAGEVVERPASVIKELVENSIDAGATRITVEIQNGGITFMRVTDNGCGISREDAPTAFLRHATSKITCADDLGCIETMGFRGEALAAISAVSKVDLMTRAREEELGTSIRVEAGNVLEVQTSGCPQGTTMVVRELFYNTPARMKFLKRDSVEGSYISGAVQRQALGHPEIAFRFIRDGKQELSTPGDGKLLSAIYNVMGRTCAQEMEAVKPSAALSPSAYGGVRVTGYVGKPTASRGSRSYQHFFVNGRYVKSRMMMTALEEAYRNQLMVGRYPICVLNIELPAAAVDVNVHPAKTEVKFLRESEVFDAIHYGVLGALSSAGARPEMALPEQKAPKQVLNTQNTQNTQNTPAQQTAAPQSGGSSVSAGKPVQQKDFYRHMTAEEYRAYTAGNTGSTGKPSAGNAGNTGNTVPERRNTGAAAAAGQAGTAERPVITVSPVKPVYPATPAGASGAGQTLLHDSMRQLPKPDPSAPGKTRTEITGDGTFVVHSAGTVRPTAPESVPEYTEAPEPAQETPKKQEQPEIPETPEDLKTPEIPEVPENPEYDQTALELPPEPETIPQPPAPAEAVQPANPARPAAEPYRIVGETMKTYILVEQGETLLLIDKHAAHERILFEKLKAQKREIVSQLLLTPIQAELSQEESAVLLEQTEVLSGLGFEIEDFGGGTLLVRAIPADIEEQETVPCLSELSQQLLSGSRPDSSTVYDEMLHTVACKAAIKGGWDTDPKEIAALVAELMGRDDIKYCPHGRPVCISLSRSHLEKQFKRT